MATLFYMYTDRHALMTSNGKTSQLIAGYYNEGVGAEASFSMITGFTQISEKLVIVADCSIYCLSLIDHTTRNISEFRALCKSCRYKCGVQAQ